MSVIVKGMEMPIGCASCFVDRAYCRLWKKVPCGKWRDERHQNCPLIELPPHGRIIDVSTVEEIRFHDADGYHVINGEQLCELEIDAPTVIEAEGETE